ncbi:MAG TPA: N-methyl-L-tryptophan oxidase [Thermomicrobiales bacterium]
MKTTYDVAVIGCGGIGSAAAYWLSRTAGSEVLVLEQFEIGHDKGASQDHSRIIRLSYHAAAYTALTPHTYTAWAEVEEESGVQLVVKCGGLDLAPGDSDALQPYADSMRAANIPFEELSADEVMKRWPQLTLRGDERAIYQADGGLVDARKAIAVHVALARLHGATILDRTPVTRIAKDGNAVRIETPAGTFHAGAVVVAADAWTNEVLEGIGVSFPLTITQEQVTYFATPHLRDYAPDRFPIWIWHGDPTLYGFPVYGEVATKAGVDVGGDVVTTETRTFEPNPRAHEQLVKVLEQIMPTYLGPILYTKTCLYTMPPDRDFILDLVSDQPRIAVAQGAAHGFKFSCLIGRIMCELVTTGKTSYPIEAFSSTRQALTDPNYPPAFNI